MIVQEDVPYTKEEVKAMVKTIHDLRNHLNQLRKANNRLGWHSGIELPKKPADGQPPRCKRTIEATILILQ